MLTVIDLAGNPRANKSWATRADEIDVSTM